MANEIENQLVQIQPKQPGEERKLSLAEVRARLSAARGKEYWQSLKQVTESDGFDELMEREFPRQASEFLDPVSRRGFLKLMGASLALAGLSACTRQPEEEIVPYVKQPEDLIPGRPKYFASAMPFPNGAQPILVKSEEFRPIKIEGNPEHPESGGATDVFTQASILDLYDPDRSQTSSYKGEPREYSDFLNFINAYRTRTRAGASGLRFLTGTCISPTFAWLMDAALKANPGSKWYQWDAVNRDNVRAGAKAAFGAYMDPIYRLETADVILSLDADFLSGIAQPGFVRIARDFAKRRKLEPRGEMSRLYVVESQMTTAGAKADHRLRLRASEVEAFAAALLAAVGGAGSAGSLSGEAAAFLQSVAKDLKAKPGASVVIPGDHQSPAVHVLAAQINQALGNAGKTVLYIDPIEPAPTEQVAGMKELAADMRAGKVDLLLMMGVNPLYDAPVDLDFAAAMQRVAETVHVGLHHDETARYSNWHLHTTHYLEMWGDARANDGTVSIIQPLIDPLYAGVSPYSIAAAFAAQPGLTPYSALKQYWGQNAKSQAGADFEAFWRKVLHDGFIPGTALPPKAVAARGGAPATPRMDAGAIEIVLRPDPTIFDGRYANNGWLQECPKWITRLTWDNAALMSLATAQQLGTREEDVIEIKAANGRKLTATVLPVPGMPDNSITLTLGYGRRDAGRVGTGPGYNAYAIRSSDAQHITWATKSDIKKTGDTFRLAIVQVHELIAGTNKSLPTSEALTRSIIRSTTLEEYEKEPGFAHSERYLPTPEHTETLYRNDHDQPFFDYSKGYQWAMTVDMNSCVGCNACVVACVAENNIPVIGKEQVKVGRQMYWLRIDTYFTGDLDAPKAVFQPMFCQHCENAPCEPVCPVGATMHTPEGLNQMVYNRCVGTRYCSNNCPYKVRRFNFLLYADYETESLKLLRNPDVSVRSRGVMEKCTYCVQRINAAKIDSETEELKLQQEDPNARRVIQDGEVITACQQACPTGALIFGNMNDPNSRVARQKKLERNYGVLAPVNTRPRTSYLAEVTNPNPELAPKGAEAGVLTEAERVHGN
jgi:molybdopterin-containing oxidoreductase family iron-sulfur binding subunit